MAVSGRARQVEGRRGLDDTEHDMTPAKLSYGDGDGHRRVISKTLSIPMYVCTSLRVNVNMY